MVVKGLKRRGYMRELSVEGSDIHFLVDFRGLSLGVLESEPVEEAFPGSGAVVYRTASGKWKGKLQRLTPEGQLDVDVSEYVSKLVEKGFDALKMTIGNDAQIKGVYLSAGVWPFSFYEINAAKKETSRKPYIQFALLTDRGAVVGMRSTKMSLSPSSYHDQVIEWQINALRKLAEGRVRYANPLTEAPRVEQGAVTRYAGVPSGLTVIASNHTRLLAVPSEDALVPVFTYLHTPAEDRVHFPVVISQVVADFIGFYRSEPVPKRFAIMWHGISHNLELTSVKHYSSAENPDHSEVANELETTLKKGDPSKIRFLNALNTTGFGTLFTIQEGIYPVGNYIAVNVGDRWYLLLLSQQAQSYKHTYKVGLAELPVHPDSIEEYRNFFGMGSTIEMYDIEDESSFSEPLITANSFIIRDKDGKVYAAGKNSSIIGEEEKSPYDLSGTYDLGETYGATLSIGSTNTVDTDTIDTAFKQLQLDKPVKSLAITDINNADFPTVYAAFLTEDGKLYLTMKESSEHPKNWRTYETKSYGPTQVVLADVERVDEILSAHTVVPNTLVGADELPIANRQVGTFVFRSGEDLLGFSIGDGQGHEGTIATIDHKGDFTEIGEKVEVHPKDVVPSIGTTLGKVLYSVAPKSLIPLRRMCRG